MNAQLEEEWKNEFVNQAFRYHYIIALVAVILNPLWAVSDYLTIPLHFWDFLSFRLIVTLTIVVTLFYAEKLRKKPVLLAMVPFVGIAIQNAYMYSVMDVSEIQRHTFAYIALFIGAGMFVLWKALYTIIIVIGSFLANCIFFYFNGKLELSEVLINGGLLTFSVAIFTIILIQTRTNLTKKEIRSRIALKASKLEIEKKSAIIENQNNDIISSMNYALRIQQSILPPHETLHELFQDYFLLYLPKDIVSGDYYWAAKVRTTPIDGVSEEIVVFAVADCTGHGVPGALMSIIGNTILNQSLKVKEVNTPADALENLDKELIKNLKNINDGMDIALCAWNKTTNVLYYAGANNPLYVVRNQELIVLKPDKQAIGGSTTRELKSTFTNQRIQLEKGDKLYLFSDGFADQFGGPESYRGGKKFKNSRMKELLIQHANEPMSVQRQRLLDAHLHWKGDLDQVDDILVWGINV